MNIDVSQYLTDLSEQLLAETNWNPVILDLNWVKNVPKRAGVYVFRENNEFIYVGETGNLRGRMNELRNSRQHTLRRSLGKRLYSHMDGFVMATDRENFPKPIELRLIEYINANLHVAYLPVDLGRKELEELINSELKPAFRLNIRGKRKS